MTFFFIFLGSHSQLKSLMTFINTISPTIKYTFTYSKQAVSFLDVHIFIFLNPENSWQISIKNQLTAWLYVTPTHHPLSCKESIIYSQELRYNMIISEDHILQEELNNLIRILVTRAYLLHVINKNLNTTILFAILIGKESASLEYLIDTIFKNEFQQIYLAHHQPKKSELTVQPSTRA